MKVFILAAGEGRRLLPLTEKVPKCMIEIDGRPLLFYAIENIKKTGLKEKDIVLIVGHRKEAIEKRISPIIKIIYNPYYNTKNNIYSVYLAKEFVDEDMVILNSDILFDYRIMEKVLNTSFENSIIVDIREDLTEEDMKVICEMGKLKRIAKTIPLSQACGEYIGIARFKGKGVFKLFSKIEEILSKGGENEWYEKAFDEMAEEVEIGCIPTEGYLWTEIDTFEDLENAQRIVKRLYKKES